jgi:hypothetical protein
VTPTSSTNHLLVNGHTSLFFIFDAFMPHAIKLRLISVVLMMIPWVITQARSFQGFDKNRYYGVIANDNIDAINIELEVIKNSSAVDKEAYEGALLMKKAGLVKGQERLRLFKSGHLKLETSIKKDNNNAELRFLRVIIQEHAPKIVNYRGNLEKDTQVIQSSFKSLSPVVQRAIVDYSKKSKVISASEL